MNLSVHITSMQTAKRFVVVLLLVIAGELLVLVLLHFGDSPKLYTQPTEPIDWIDEIDEYCENVTVPANRCAFTGRACGLCQSFVAWVEYDASANECVKHGGVGCSEVAPFRDLDECEAECIRGSAPATG